MLRSENAWFYVCPVRELGLIKQSPPCLRVILNKYQLFLDKNQLNNCVFQDKVEKVVKEKKFFYRITLNIYAIH